MRTLKILFFLELALGCAWAGPCLTMKNPGLGIVLIFFMIAPFYLGCMITGAIFYFRRPDTRARAKLVFLAPPAIIVLPVLSRSACKNPLFASTSSFLMALACLVAALVLFFPRHLSELIPTRALTSRRFNRGLLAAQSLLVLAPASLLGLHILLYQALAARAQAAPLVLGAFLLTVASVLVALPALGYSWFGLFQDRDREHQRLRMIQAALAGVQLAAGVPMIRLAMAAMTSPG